MTGIRIAVTGTPGVGKTTFCERFKWSKISVQELAEQHGCIDDADEDGGAPIDVDALSQEINWPEGDYWLIDGHLSHLLPVDAAIVIRCNPSALQRRLESRGYSAQKINENVECELIGSIVAECLDLPFLELDSADGLESMIASAEAWITDGFKPQRPSEPIDWIHEIHGED